jgi:SAM-dependent methyltransferase
MLVNGFYYGDGDDKHPGMAAWTAEVSRIIKYCKGRGIDIGAGGRTLYQDTVTVDQSGGHDIVCDAHSIPVSDKSFDYVFSCHCLEHLQCPLKALNEWVRIARKWVVVIIPDSRYIDRIGSGREDLEHKTDFILRTAFELTERASGAEPWEIGYTLWRSSIYFVLLVGDYRPDLNGRPHLGG